MIKTVLEFQLSKIRTNIFTFILVVLSAILSLCIGFWHQQVFHSIMYLFTLWLFTAIVDGYVLKYPHINSFPVREPAKESAYFLLSFTLGMLFLYLRFSPEIDWQNLQGIVKLAILPLILFLFPIALAIILLLKKYKPADLGIRTQGVWIAIPIVLISFLGNRILAPESHPIEGILLESGGILPALFSGFIVAALSEEFFRVIGQTRLGSIFNNFGLGWFMTTMIWAVMHAPKWYAESGDLSEAILGSIRIIPIGLFWGYLTHRTKSILPSVLVHGANIWGLQNF